MQMDKNERLVLPKNIRQMGTFGDTYKVYVEDFVYTYVHQFLHQRKKEEAVLAAVLLGKTFPQDGQEYIFINGAQKVDFRISGETSQFGNGQDLNRTKPATVVSASAVVANRKNGEEEKDLPEKAREESVETEMTAPTQADRISGGKDAAMRQQEFWNRVYQRIKESFDDCEILGWYFNLDGSGLEVSTQLQQFFESTYRKGSRFLYFEDSVEKIDAFFVQEQHRLQRLSGYAVYYEKNPQMQEFMVAERELLTPKPLRDSYRKTDRDEVVENYRAIMNKLNEKPARKKFQPVVYVAGAAVLAVVVAMGIGQIGNYQNLKVLEQTMQTLSNAVGDDGEDALSEDGSGISEKANGENERGEEENNVNDTASDKTDIVTEGETGGTGADGSTGVSSGSAEDTANYSDDAEGDTSAGMSSAANNSEGESSEDGGTSDETAETSSLADYYIVKKGDSLVSISKELYGTADKVEEICELNAIENMDVIYEGQKLLLP